MAQINYTSAKRFRCNDDDELDVNSQGGNSLRDSILKSVVAEQLKKRVDIGDCIKNRDKFTLGGSQKDVSSHTKGLRPNQSYKLICDDFHLKDTLYACGLNDEDIKVLNDDGSNPGKQSEQAYRVRLENIKQKIEDRKNQLEANEEEFFSSAVELNRREFEEECRRDSSNTAERLTKCLIKLKAHPDPSIHPDHPINYIKDLEQELFPTVVTRQPEPATQPESSRKRKMTSITSQLKYFDEKPKTFWDMSETPVVVKSINSEDDKPCNPVIKRPMKTPIVVIASKPDLPQADYSKPFVWTLPHSKLIPRDSITKNKLPSQEFSTHRELPSHNPGSPSQTLYIKNLPPKVTPIDLVSIFGHFETETKARIQYRILKGRMKGQAFIKLSCVEAAVNAFDLCDGFVLKGKPIVIEYSKKKD